MKLKMKIMRDQTAEERKFERIRAKAREFGNHDPLRTSEGIYNKQNIEV